MYVWFPTIFREQAVAFFNCHKKIPNGPSRITHEAATVTQHALIISYLEGADIVWRKRKASYPCFLPGCGNSTGKKVKWLPTVTKSQKRHFRKLHCSQSAVYNGSPRFGCDCKVKAKPSKQGCIYHHGAKLLHTQTHIWEGVFAYVTFAPSYLF